MSNTDYLENAILNHVFRGVVYTPPATLYLALFSNATTEGGGGTEITGNAYARQVITFAAPSGGSTTNSNTVTFPIATPAGYNPTHGAFFDAVSGGNMLRQAGLTNPQAVAAGNNLSFPPGSILLTQD